MAPFLSHSHSFSITGQREKVGGFESVAGGGHRLLRQRVGVRTSAVALLLRGAGRQGPGHRLRGAQASTYGAHGRQWAL